ncbi:hypothetical protein ACVPOW_02690 [Staphylococcus aureus]
MRSQRFHLLFLASDSIRCQNDKTESVDVPYTGKNDKSQKVKVYIKDKDNDGSTEKGSFDITSDQRIDIPLRIEKGKTASYIVKVDGKTVAEKEISYDDV